MALMLENWVEKTCNFQSIHSHILAGFFGSTPNSDPTEDIIRIFKLVKPAYLESFTSFEQLLTPEFS